MKNFFNVESYFPLSYAWSINGTEVNSRVSYFETADDIDGKEIAKDYNKDPDALKDRIFRLDRAAIREAKDWLEEANYKHEGWPEHFTLIRRSGDSEEIIYEGSNATEYTSFEVARKKHPESFAEKVAKLDKKFKEENSKDDYTEMRVGDVPFDRKISIDINFYEGNNIINDLSVQANSLRDLAEKTKNSSLPLSYKEWISHAYYGKNWYSYGEDLKNYAEALMGNLTHNKGLINSMAKYTPEDFDSKWISCVVIVQEHVASFETFNIENILDKEAPITFNSNEPEPTLKSLNIDYPPYYKEEEISLVGPSKADWETLGDEAFPLEIQVLEDKDYDFDNYFILDSAAELKDLINDLPEGIGSGIPNLEGTKSQTINSIIDWFNSMVKDVKKYVLPNTATYYSNEDTPSYRWLTILLNDENGDVLSYETIDMLDYFKKANISKDILDELRYNEEPYIPTNIY